MTIGNKIEFLRRSRGMSQETLAMILSVSRQTIYKWEQNLATPSLEKIKAITNYFQISYDDLLNDCRTIDIIIR